MISFILGGLRTTNYGTKILNERESSLPWSCVETSSHKNQLQHPLCLNTKQKIADTMSFTLIGQLDGDKQAQEVLEGAGSVDGLKKQL